MRLLQVIVLLAVVQLFGCGPGPTGMGDGGGTAGGGTAGGGTAGGAGGGTAGGMAGGSGGGMAGGSGGGMAGGSGGGMAGGSGGGTGGGGVVVSSDGGTPGQGFYGHLAGVTFGGGKFVAVGETGTTASSTNGLDWDFSFAETSESFTAVSHFNNLFIATSDGGNIFTSPTGAAWTRRSTGASNPLLDVTASPTRAVAIGATRTVYSADGLTWNAGSFPTGRNGVSIAYGNGQYWALSTTGVIESTDGITFSNIVNRTFNAPFPTSIRFLNGFYAAGMQRVYALVPNNNTLIYSGSQEFRALAAGNGTLVALGRWGGLATTFDGGTMTQREPPGGSTLNAAVFGNGAFVAVGDDGQILRSTDGVTWTVVAEGATFRYSSMAYGAGRFVAMAGANGSYGRSLTSTDGVNWSFLPRLGYAVRYLGPTLGFASVGAEGKAAFSADGLTWNRVQTTGLAPATDIAFGAGRWVHVGGFGEIHTSPDAGSWSRADSGITNQALLSVVYAQSQFVANGPPGYALTSPDGLVWTRRNFPLGVNDFTNTLDFQNNQWLTAGVGKVLSSPDAVMWTSTLQPQFGGGITRLHHDGTQYVASRSQPHLLTSPNGLTWTARDGGLQTNGQLELGAFGGGTWAFGSDSTRVASTTDLQSLNFFNAQPNSQVVTFVERADAGLIAIHQNGYAQEAPDRRRFTLRNLGLELGPIGRAARNGNTIVFTAGNSVYTSIDNGGTWQRIQLGQYSGLLGPAVYAFGNFTVPEQLQTGSFSSPDGLVWTTTTTAAFRSPAAFANGRLVLGSTLRRSDNGTMTTPAVLPMDGGTMNAQDIGFARGLWVAVGSDGVIFTSADGAVWDNATPLLSELRDFRTVTATSTGWVAAGDNGLLLTSTDGRAWVRRYAPSNLVLRCSAPDGADALVGGDKGLILRVTP